MLTSSAKAKARALQNRVARDLAKATGLTYGRPDADDCDVKGRQMGMIGPDIVRLTPEARERIPFFIECKARESWSFSHHLLTSKAQSPLVGWYEATVRAAKKEPRRDRDTPLLIVSQNRCPPLAVAEYGPLALVLRNVPGDVSYVRLKSAMGVLVIVDWRAFLACWYGRRP